MTARTHETAAAAEMAGAPEAAGTEQPDVMLDRVRQALGTVRDPELDEPITDLGFVQEIRVEGAQVLVRLRLPTYFCAPNFAYLMVADARDAVGRLSDVEYAEIRLDDHFASEEINAGVAADAGFAGSFPQQANSELDELRTTFRRKAHTACLERACQRLLAEGWQVEDLPAAHLSDLPESAERASLVRRRCDLDLPVDERARVFVDDDGTPIAPEQAPVRLRFARAVRVSIDGNAGWCRGLLRTRYPDTEEDGS